MSESSPLLPAGRAVDVRGRLIMIAFVVGLSVPALMWLLVLTGAMEADKGSDKIAVAGVLLSVYAPILAFWNNKGESRSWMEKLHHFGSLWYYANTGYQCFWELPWFIFKKALMNNHIGPDNHWAWPWWAFGSADTRYLQHNDLVIGITGMDAMASLMEAVLVLLDVRGYRVLGAWTGVLIQFAMGWGQGVWYLGEVYNNPAFKNIEDGWFGLYIKYGVLNVPWLIFPIIGNIGFMWFLADTYRKAGPVGSVEGLSWWEHFKKATLIMKREKKAAAAAAATPGQLQLPEGEGIGGGEEEEEGAPSERMAGLLLRFAFAYPIVFLVVDFTVWRVLNNRD